MFVVKFKTITDAGLGSSVNEDLIGHYGNIYWIMDGATPLSGSRFFPGSSDALWLVTELDKALKAVIAQANDCDLNSLLESALSLVKQRALTYGFATAKISPYDMPSCSLIMLKVEPGISGVLEYLILGDCTLVFEYDSQLTIVKDNTVTKLDNQVVQMLKAKKQSGTLDDSELSVYRSTLLQKNRALMNTSEGYWSCTWDKKGVKHSITQRLEFDGDLKILACTDGFSSLVDLYNQISWSDLLQNRLSIHQALLKIRDIEAKDVTKEKYERLKVSDDASALHLSISKNSYKNDLE
jgi:hypothetical protein